MTWWLKIPLLVLLVALLIELARRASLPGFIRPILFPAIVAGVGWAGFLVVSADVREAAILAELQEKRDLVAKYQARDAATAPDGLVVGTVWCVAPRPQ